MKLKRCLMISLLMMLIASSISAEIIEVDGYILQGLNFYREGFFFTREDLEEMKNSLDELEGCEEMSKIADETITSLRIDATKLGTIIVDLEDENKGLKIQRIIFGISGIGIGIGITLLISNFVN